MTKRPAHVYKAGPADWRVRVWFAGRWRDSGGVFKTLDAARAHLTKLTKETP